MAGTKTPSVILNTNSSLQSALARGMKFETGSFAFDSSYPIGGESMTFGFTPSVVEIPSQGGYKFEYDHTNSKIKAFKPGKSLIVDEVVTVTSHIGKLKHKPFYILAIESTAGTTTGPFNAIPTGETPLTTECAVTFTSGTLTFLSTDAVTAARVTYIPLHESGPFSAANLVVDEAVTASASKTDLAYQAAAVQYVYDGTDNARCALEPVGEAPSATHTAVVDIDDGSDDTNIDSHADDAGNALKVTYIKYGTFKPYQQLGDGDLTLASEIYNFTTNHYHHLAIPGLGTQLVGETGAAGNVELIWSGPTASVAAGVPTLDFELNQWSTNEATAIATLAVPIIFLDALENEGAWLEVGEGDDLSALTTVRYVAFGY